MCGINSKDILLCRESLENVKFLVATSLLRKMKE